MSNSVASPYLEVVLAEQDRETLRRLELALKNAQGPLERADIERAITQTLERLEGKPWR